jgi:hypothetical protein
VNIQCKQGRKQLRTYTCLPCLESTFDNVSEFEARRSLGCEVLSVKVPFGSVQSPEHTLVLSSSSLELLHEKLDSRPENDVINAVRGAPRHYLTGGALSPDVFLGIAFLKLLLLHVPRQLSRREHQGWSLENLAIRRCTSLTV